MTIKYEFWREFKKIDNYKMVLYDVVIKTGIYSSHSMNILYQIEAYLLWKCYQYKIKRDQLYIKSKSILKWIAENWTEHLNWKFAFNAKSALLSNWNANVLSGEYKWPESVVCSNWNFPEFNELDKNLN